MTLVKDFEKKWGITLKGIRKDAKVSTFLKRKGYKNLAKLMEMVR